MIGLYYRLNMWLYRKCFNYLLRLPRSTATLSVSDRRKLPFNATRRRSIRLKDTDRRVLSKIKNDRRVSSRLETDLPLSCSPINRLGFGSSEALSGTLQDASQDGLRFRIACPKNSQKKLLSRQGRRIQITLIRKSLELLRVQGVIVRYRKIRSSKGTLIELSVALNPASSRQKKKVRSMFDIANFLCERLFFCGHKNLCVRSVNSLKDLHGALKLLYREYLKRTYCQENPLKMLLTPYVILPNSKTLILWENKTLAGTATLIGDSAAGLPSESIYGKEIKRLRKKGYRLSEISYVALDSKCFKKGTYTLKNIEKHAASFFLFKKLHHYARLVPKYTHVFISVHPKHQNLYKFMGFKNVGPVKKYPNANNNLAVAMLIDLNQFSAHAGLNKMFFEGPFDVTQLCYDFSRSRERVKSFLCNKSLPIWDYLPQSAKHKVLKLYPWMRARSSTRPKVKVSSS